MVKRNKAAEINWEMYFTNQHASLSYKTAQNSRSQRRIGLKNKKKTKKIITFYYVFLFILLFCFLFFLTISLSFAGTRSNPSLTANQLDQNIYQSNTASILENYIYKQEKSKKNKNIQTNEFNQQKKIRVIQLKKYRVKNNDSISKIAQQFSLYMDTILLNNKIKSPHFISAGTILLIPNQDGRMITIRKNDSIHQIANRYGVSWKKIVDVNNIESSLLLPGKKLFIPGSRMTQYEKNKFYQKRKQKTRKNNTPNPYFYWPLRGKITSYYGMRKDPFRNIYLFHKGIDIKADPGTFIKAPRSGKVIYIGWNKIYGNILMIRHDQQFVTVYGHLEKVKVKLNQSIRKNQTIATVGSSGRSTGPHLHFEIRKNGKILDPLTMLK